MVDTVLSGNTYTIVDTSTSTTLIYVGKAEIGSATSDDVWSIFVIDTANGAAITWADGNDNFDNIMDNRAILPYS